MRDLTGEFDHVEVCANAFTNKIVEYRYISLIDDYFRISWDDVALCFKQSKTSPISTFWSCQRTSK